MSIKKRGFASIAPERQREIAAMGGRKAHEIGTAHEWDSTEAAVAGRKGGRNAAMARLRKNQPAA